MNKFFLSGDVLSTVINSNATALVEVSYGASRSSTGRRVEFTNSVVVRIPANLLFKLSDTPLAVGAWVEVMGRLQGRTDTATGQLSVELVAESVSVTGYTVAE